MMGLQYFGALLIAVLASVMLAAGLAIMKSRAVMLPAAHGTASLRAIVSWMCDLPWLGGLIIESAGYLLYVAALAEAPVSLVAVMMQGGIAVFVLIAVVVLHERANRVEGAGILGIILAMILLALSMHSVPAPGRLNSFALAWLSLLAIIGTAIVYLVNQLRRNGTAPAIASGIAFGMAALYTKAMADIAVNQSANTIVSGIAASPWLYLMLTTNIWGLVLLQNSFHWARGIIAMPLSSAISNLLPIAGGILAFDENLPSEPASAALRISAFALTVMASVLVAGAGITYNDEDSGPAGSPLEERL